VAIQRWTLRVVAPMLRAAWLGVNSSGIVGAIVALRGGHRKRLPPRAA
jgi:hypothetical protein